MRSGGDQRSRGRQYGNRPPQSQQGGGGGGQQRSQSFNSHGPINSNGSSERLRGSPHQLYERYMTLAQDAARNEDRVSAESYYQYAEHYFRVDHAGREGYRSDGQPTNGQPANGQPAEASPPIEQTEIEPDRAPSEPKEGDDAPPIYTEV